MENFENFQKILGNISSSYYIQSRFLKLSLKFIDQKDLDSVHAIPYHYESFKTLCIQNEAGK